jgi:hypothetical protein
VAVKREVALLALLLVGGPRAQAGDHFSEEVNGMPTCRQKAAATPTSWDRKNLGEEFSFAMPSDCQSVQREEHSYVHGGARWRCGSTTVEVVWGMWGRTSFGGRACCTAKVAGKRVMMATRNEEAHVSTIVWYPTGTVHEPILSVWSERSEDTDLVSGIALSGRIGSAKR